MQDLPRRNIKLVVAYDGTRFHGWQRQLGVPTVQENLERAAAMVVGHPLHVLGAGRTDAGVHALGQVASFRTTNLVIPLVNLRRAISSRCGREIAVLSAAVVRDDFHASASAVGKTYRYRIHVGPEKPVMLASQVCHYPRPLDAARMAQAARLLLGEHDFRGFAYSAEKREDTVRTITACDVSERGQEIHVTVTGDGFLYKMVRNIVGTLIEIGRGHWAPERIDQVIASRQREYAGPTAVPGGLYMVHVFYPPQFDPIEQA